MARFVIGTVAAAGHVYPVLPIAEALVQAGHDVRWYTGQAFQSIIESIGVRYLPMQQGLDPSDPAKAADLMRRRTQLKGLELLKFDLTQIFIDGAIGQYHDLMAILQTEGTDVLLSDVFFLAMAWVRETTQIPWAAIGITCLPFSGVDVAPMGLGLMPTASAIGRLRNRLLTRLTQKFVLQTVTNHLDQVRQSLGLQARSQTFFNALLSPDLHLQGCTPSFEYPRSDLPPQVQFVGPLLHNSTRTFEPPAWWADLDNGKPVVLVTQGTIANDPNQLILPTLEALAEEDLLIVVTTGQPLENLSWLKTMPANVRVAEFIPYDRLLTKVDILISNGGYNGIQLALANGVPMIVAGQTEDKAEIASRIVWSGTGINLRTTIAKPSQIRQAVQTIQTSSQYRDRARQLQAEIAQYNPVERSLHHIMTLIPPVAVTS